MKAILISIAFALIALAAHAEVKRGRVFVALCDNASQGIAPVPARIGDGDNARENLYWGCTEGLSAYFRRNPRWTLTKKNSNLSTTVLERLEFEHATKKIVLVADAYRGSAIRECLADFERCVAGGQYDLVAYIGHNGLMDFDLPEADPPAGANRTEAIVLCCKSNPYFAERLRRLRARPILLTDQFMYPGSFILDAAIEKWLAGGSLAEIRDSAGKAYGANQNISVKAATGVFTRIDEKSSPGNRGEASATSRISRE